MEDSSHEQPDQEAPKILFLRLRDQPTACAHRWRSRGHRGTTTLPPHMPPVWPYRSWDGW